MLRSSLFTLFAVCGFSAHAEERPRALVLPTQLEGYVPGAGDDRPKLQTTLEERLRQARLDVVSPGRLSPADAACAEEACLRAISIRRKTSIVVAARLKREAPQIPAYHLQVLAFVKDALGGALRKREGDCVNCSEIVARDQLAALLGAVIAKEPDPMAALPPDAGATHGGTPNAAAIPDVGVVNLPAQAVPLRVRVAEGALGVAALAGVAGVLLGAKFLYDDGRRTCVLTAPIEECETTVHTQNMGIGFVVGGALLAAGAAIGIWQVEVKLARPERNKLTLIPSLFPGGAGLSVGGTL